MDCLGTLEISFVELTGVVLFREEKYSGGGIMTYQVYAVRTDQGIVVIRPSGKRHKRISVRWLKEKFSPFNLIDLPFSRIERVKLLNSEIINIKKVYWKHKITENKMKLIIEVLNKSKEIYDN